MVSPKPLIDLVAAVVVGAVGAFVGFFVLLLNEGLADNGLGFCMVALGLLATPFAGSDFCCVRDFWPNVLAFEAAPEFPLNLLCVAVLAADDDVAVAAAFAAEWGGGLKLENALVGDISDRSSGGHSGYGRIYRSWP